MVAVNLKSLVGKLDDVCRRSLEGAAGLCLSRTHYNVEIEHWLVKLLETPGTDIAAIAKHYGADRTQMAHDLTRVLDRLKTGNARPPALSPNIVDLTREAWVLASVEFGAPRARSGHLLLALLTDETFHRQAREASSQFERISPDALRRELATITANTLEADFEAASAPAPSESGVGPRPIPGSKTPNLDQFTIDLTDRARRGEIDPVLGRDFEIRQCIDILTRRRQNNPILTGEAGVGKTAVAEGFAVRVATGDVPEPLRNVAVRTLDLGLLQAGAGVKGEFENRLKSVLQEVKSSPKPVILFIDEAHQMIGAGAQAGQGDAANLLKPALARGEVRTIAATTWAEYKKYFERDAALARRFQVVKIEEPSEPAAVEMMRGLVATLEKHHGVAILDEAVKASVHLSHRYVSGRQLPDKSVSVLDTACARVNLSQTSVPPQVEDANRRIEQLEVAIGILRREQDSGGAHEEEIRDLGANLETARADLARLDAQLAKERGLVKEIHELLGKLIARAKAADGGSGAAPAAPPAGSAPAPAPAPPLSPADRTAAHDRLAALSKELDEAQGEEPLTHVCVDAQAIAAVIAGWTGIPVGRMVTDEITSVLELRKRLEERVVGQSHALEAIAQSIRTSRANLTDPKRPIGVFLMVGTSGVGKTETAIALAEQLYGGEQNMTVINMSEFKEEHKVSLLMGSPPGYVGYGEGGVLTEAVRRRPYSVVLLDEMEKAHPGVQDIFYQVFDKGSLRDGEGRDIDFKNTVIIMTSNAGTDAIQKLCADPETAPEPEGLVEALRPELLKVFKPAFLGRLQVVVYYPLRDEVMRQIIHLKLGKVRRRVEENYKAFFQVEPPVVDGILERCREVESGARNADHILNRTLLPQLAATFLARMAEGRPIEGVTVGLEPSGAFRYDVVPA